MQPQISFTNLADVSEIRGMIILILCRNTRGIGHYIIASTGAYTNTPAHRVGVRANDHMHTYEYACARTQSYMHAHTHAHGHAHLDELMGLAFQAGPVSRLHLHVKN